jgi:hypothetical protein
VGYAHLLSQGRFRITEDPKALEERLTEHLGFLHRKYNADAIEQAAEADASEFEWPPGTFEGDAAAVAREGSLLEAIRAKREANLPNRFNAERVNALYHGDPEYDTLMDIAWSATPGVMKIFGDCSQLAHALDNLAKFYDQMLLVPHFTQWIAPLSAALKSNADVSLKQVPIDFVVDCVSAALASMAIFVVSPEAASLSDADFLQATAATLAIDTDKVTRDCQRAQMADRFLAEYKQHGCSNPPAPKPAAVKPVQPKENTGDKDKGGDKKRKRDDKATKGTTTAALSSAGATGSGSKTPRGLCYSFACKFFSVHNHKGCTFVGCSNEHPSWSLLTTPVEKDKIKGDVGPMPNVPLRDKLIQAIDDA